MRVLAFLTAPPQGRRSPVDCQVFYLPGAPCGCRSSLLRMSVYRFFPGAALLALSVFLLPSASAAAPSCANAELDYYNPTQMSAYLACGDSGEIPAQTYVGSTFSFSHPASWQVRGQGNLVVVSPIRNPSKAGEWSQINITLSAVPNTAFTLGRYDADMRRMTSSEIPLTEKDYYMPSVMSFASGATFLFSHPAYWYEISSETRSAGRLRMVVAVGDGTLYEIWVKGLEVSFERGRKVFEQVMASLTLVKGSPTSSSSSSQASSRSSLSVPLPSSELHLQLGGPPIAFEDGMYQVGRSSFRFLFEGDSKTTMLAVRAQSESDFEENGFHPTEAPFIRRIRRNYVPLDNDTWVRVPVSGPYPLVNVWGLRSRRKQWSIKRYPEEHVYLHAVLIPLNAKQEPQWQKAKYLTLPLNFGPLAQ